MIKSINYNQQELINDILTLHNAGNSIECDCCYNVGGFYKNSIVEEPLYKFDIKPQSPGVLQRDCRELFKIYGPEKFKSIIFDPPFMVGGNDSKMSKTYGSFNSVDEFFTFITDSLISIQGSLKNNGILIIKCQDFVYGRKNYSVLNYILNRARENNLIYLDIFILTTNSRINQKTIKNQQHARKYHCYFIVFKKNNKKCKM